MTKKQKYRVGAWSLFFWLHLAASLFAQPNDIRFEHISVEQGLSHFTITAIVQDHQGFLWFGTEHGLNRYDGHNFTVYKPNPSDAHSLPHPAITSLCVDHQGNLWVGTGGGLCRYNPDTDKFIRYPHDPNNPNSLSGDAVNTIFEDSMGKLWIGTYAGLNQYDSENNLFIHYRHDPNDTTSLSSDGISSIIEDRTGTLWIGTYTAGLNQYERKNNTFVHYRHDAKDPSGLSSNHITCILEDRRGVIWIGASAGLNRYDPTTDKIVRCRYDPKDPYTVAPDFICSLYEDSKGVLWVGTFGIGLLRYDPNTDRFFRYVHDPDNHYSLEQNRVDCIYEDRSGVLWIGTYRGGLNRYDRKQDAFIRYKVDDEVYAVFQDRQGELWIGTGSAGLQRYDRQSNRLIQYLHDPKNPESLSHNYVLAIHEDSRGELWMGTGWGLNRYDARRNCFVRYNHEPPDPATYHEYREVKTIHEDADGGLWIGTKGSGLCRWDREKKTFTFYRHDPKNPQSLGGENVWAICEAQNGDLWIGTFGGGVNRFDKKTEAFSRYQHDPQNPRSLNNNAIYSVYADTNGSIWIGTYGGGLNRYDPTTGVFTHYTERDGLPDDFVKGILPDGQGNLWLSTDKGLSKFNPQTRTFKNYTKKDGLHDNVFLSGAFHKSKDGRFYFGGRHGVTAFHPDSIKDNPYIPPVVLTRFKVFDQPVHLPRSLTSTKEIRLSYKQNFFSFEFVALDYTAPAKNQYAHKLEGFDKDWIHAGARRYANYTNVDPGHYVFRVKGANSDGVWHEQGAVINVIITPPFWQTWWFRILAISSVLFSAFTWYKRRIRRLEEKRQALEQQVKERTASAEALQNALSEVENLKNRLYSENVYLQDEIKLEHNFTDIISRSQALKKILGKVEQVAATEATVLILGESGTGKELLARAVHNLSNRRERPLVKVNCAALPTNLIESELFGHEKGAFTGAISRKIGRFELADGGTIFLDEIGELPPELQAKLLRVLQEGEFERVGGQQTMKVDTRVIAATNRDLKEEIAHGRFREDLYYRLHVFPITIPPLRERREDIPLLINHFVKKYGARTGKKIETVSQNVIETLQAYDWPGNVRELENVIERAVIVSQGKQLKLDDWLPHPNFESDEPGLVTLEDMERNHIIKTLKMTQWRISGERGAAKILNIKPTTLRSRMEKLGIKR